MRRRDTGKHLLRISGRRKTLQFLRAILPMLEVLPWFASRFSSMTWHVLLQRYRSVDIRRCGHTRWWWRRLALHLLETRKLDKTSWYTSASFPISRAYCSSLRSGKAVAVSRCCLLGHLWTYLSSLLNVCQHLSTGNKTSSEPLLSLAGSCEDRLIVAFGTTSYSLSVSSRCGSMIATIG